jgi:two-component system cell cycle sensor histidine kinase/response regulator CckA
LQQEQKTMAYADHSSFQHDDPPSGPLRPSARLEEDLDLFQTLINQSNDAILIVDTETSLILYINNKACANLGYTCEELLTKRFTDVTMNVRDRSSWNRLVKRVRTHGYALFESEQRKKDLTRLPVEVNMRHIHHDGREYLVAVARDISERRRAEDALAAEKNTLEAVLAAMDNGITVQDRDFQVLYQNDLHRARFGDHVGESCYRAYYRRDRPCDECLVERSFRNGGVHRREVYSATDAGPAYTEITTSPVRDVRGNIIAGVEVVRDITKRKRLETQLVHAQRLEAIGQLAGGVAHDFNNLLTQILGYGDILRAKLADRRPLQADVDRILRSAERAADLTKSLLAFSRRQVIKIRPVDLNEVIVRMEDLLRRLAGEGVSFEMDLAPHGLSVMADAGQMEQVLINLVTNARDAMTRGGRIVLRTGLVELGDEFRRAHGYGSPGTFALLSVSDTGIGMDERTVTSIFEPFFTTKEVGRGTGLGLSLVYGVVKQHNGYITVKSEVGKGTEFSLYLPAAAAQSDEYAAPSLAPGPAQATGTVLVAEDDAEVRSLARAILEQAGYTVIEAADGAEAVDRFREQGSRIDLAVLDVMMPVKNGREAFREIRDLRPGTQVLFISGYTTDIIRKWDQQGGGVHFLLKPFTATRLLGIVRALLEHGRTNSA